MTLAKIYHIQCIQKSILECLHLFNSIFSSVFIFRSEHVHIASNIPQKIIYKDQNLSSFFSQY